MRPMPTTSHSSWPLSMSVPASVRMPQTLRPLIVKVVHPFDAQFQSAQGLDSPGHGHRRTDGRALGIGSREGGPQDEGEVDPLPGGAFKPPPQPPASRLLMGREHQRTVGCTAQCQLLGRQVGALQRVVDVNGGGVGAHCFGAEGVTACQPVAPARAESSAYPWAESACAALWTAARLTPSASASCWP